MRLRLANDQLGKIVHALRRAGRSEIGGQLFGEQLAPSDFRINECTIQATQGTHAHFTVDVANALRDAAAFFERTNHQYERFNYVGEWHSHPSFSVDASREDIDTMRALVHDAEFKGNFAVLMIVRMDRAALRCAANVFSVQDGARPVQLEVDRD